MDLNDFLPIDDYEGTYPITVDGIGAEGKFNINTRLFYRSDELKEHLEKLAEDNPNQKIPIEIEFHDVNRKGFQFTLKRELVEAIETLYEDLEVKYPHNFKVLEEMDLNNFNSLDNYLNEDLSDDFMNEKYDSFYDYLIDNGYTFSKETIENFLLSLKIKPFAILTGNSGTGKTKLSQLFAKYLICNEEYTEGSDLSKNISMIPNYGDDSEFITFKDKNSYKREDFFSIGIKTLFVLLGSYKYRYSMDLFLDDFKINRFITFQPFARSYDKKLMKHLNSLDDLSEVEIKINKKDLVETFLKENSIEKTNLSFERKRGKWSCWVFPKTEWENILNIRTKYSWKAIVDGIETTFDFGIRVVDFCIEPYEYDFFEEVFNKKEENDRINIKADLSSLKIIENNFEPDFNLEEEFGVNFIQEGSKDYLKNNFSNPIIGSNYKIIPVGANWTENRNIVGYYTIITNKYESTPAYDLIKQAQANSEPHFLILDEMNLSHVERYFADFLSAIESGENIPLYGEKELKIPSNLFIIGTVNVDETTYMFSPKVLDRANVLEFETPSARDYILGKIDNEAPDGDLSYLEDPMAGCEVRNYDIDKLRSAFEGVKFHGKDFWEVLSLEIDKFQTILKGSGFEFGFRVINEIIRFMLVAWRYEGSPEEWNGWERYFDAQIKQKILPKLHGSEKIIGETLEKLYKECLDTVIDDKEMKKYPESSDKLEEMTDVLRKQRYVSFIN